MMVKLVLLFDHATLPPFRAELKLGSLSKQARWKQPNLLCVHEYNKQLKADD
jgi:hypothetical protein